MNNNFSILIAEDDNVIRQNIIKLLKLYFKIIYEAEDGLEAFDIYNEKKPDIILTDNIMPSLCGMELVKKIRKNDNEVKIIILTAHSDENQLLDAVKLNLTEYILKPIVSNAFLELIENIIKELGNKDKIYLADNYIWNKYTNTLTKKNNIIKLTKNESKLMTILASYNNINVDIDYLANNIWDEKILKNYKNSVRNLINKFHKKLNCEIIESIYGNGYKIIKK